MDKQFKHNEVIRFTGLKDVKEMEKVLQPAEDLMKAFNVPAIVLCRGSGYLSLYIDSGRLHVYYQCDNPKCKYRLEVPRAEAKNFHYCPRCGVKEGKFPPLHARKVSKK